MSIVKKISIHGQYTDDGNFNMLAICGGSGTDQNDHNIAMQALRLANSSTTVMLWDVHNWDEEYWG